MMDRFEENEYLIMAMFRRESRRQTMEEIRAIIPFVESDTEMLSLVNVALRKMEQLSDEEFLNLDLELYQEGETEE